MYLAQSANWGHCFYVPYWTRARGFYVVIRATWKCNRLQTEGSIFVISYFKTPSVGPPTDWARDLPLTGPALYQLSLPDAVTLWRGEFKDRDGSVKPFYSQECRKSYFKKSSKFLFVKYWEKKYYNWSCESTAEEVSFDWSHHRI